jgi:RNA recognition motif-containing protein
MARSTALIPARDRHHHDMATIFISSLPFRADEKFIRELFAPYGKVGSVELHADWVNPTYEPYAYVEVDTPDPGRAVDALDGQKFGQNHIRVHERVTVPTRAAKAG